EADDLQAGEDARPDAVEDGLQEAEVEAVEVGGHLVEVTARLLPHPAAREAALGRDAAHQAGQLGVAQHLPAHQPPRQERRAPHQALLAIEEYLQRARQPPHDALVALAPVVLHEAVEDDLAPEGELGLLGVPEVVEEALRLARGRRRKSQPSSSPSGRKATVDTPGAKRASGSPSRSRTAFTSR